MEFRPPPEVRQSLHHVHGDVAVVSLAPACSRRRGLAEPDTLVPRLAGCWGGRHRVSMPSRAAQLPTSLPVSTSHEQSKPNFTYG